MARARGTDGSLSPKKGLGNPATQADIETSDAATNSMHAVTTATSMTHAASKSSVGNDAAAMTRRRLYFPNSPLHGIRARLL